MPGNRVTILGIYCIRKQNAGGKGRGQQKGAVGVRDPYIRVLGIEVEFFLSQKYIFVVHLQLVYVCLCLLFT